MRYIFEVKHTHATTTTVRPEPWFEFTTERIARAETELNDPDPDVNFNKTILLTCVRQSINHYCSRCIKDIEKNKLISVENERYRIELQKKKEQEQIELQKKREKTMKGFIRHLELGVSIVSVEEARTLRI